MAASIYPDYPPNLTSEQSDYLLSNIKDWSILNGLAVRPSPSFVSERTDPSRSLAITAPVTLFPSLFPKACFDEAQAIQSAYNELYACVANDEEWLGEVVKEYGAFLSTSSILATSDHAQNVSVLEKFCPIVYLGSWVFDPISSGKNRIFYCFLILCMQIGRSG